ncbi:hypothetical protein GOP47_0025660 [Adiantum capillus-veneris]|uniref:FLZ-type domain-containing protein n=1 Tax=Adiantum capillus-veneris TaxID=13818 RepID=A0A9D4U350_ADICA|nr:hypothetical protein GOP47_0025660 [Adiantum capillus-veneris]
MAMLGKRFHRTISMSQIGPSSGLHSEKAQAHPCPAAPSPAFADPSPKLPLILHDSPQKTNEQLLLQAAATQWDALKARQQAEEHHRQQHHHHQHSRNHHPYLHVHHETAASNPWEALKGIGSGPQQDDLNASKQPAAGATNQAEILKNAEAMMMMMMMQQNRSHESSAHSFVKGDDTHVMASSPPNETHLHLGLWSHFPANPRSSPSISGAHFLDACFLCKRRLRHERDIFIYRGDIAFCSEECRHRQILIDETRSSRACRKGGAALGTTP